MESKQYTSKAFRDRCFAAGIIPSAGRTGSCFDNAQAESTNATIKQELINLRTWKNLNEVRLSLFEFTECDYNCDRIQKTSGFLTPAQFEALQRLEFTRAASSPCESVYFSERPPPVHARQSAGLTSVQPSRRNAALR